MTKKTRSFRPSPAILISCLALFLALTGSAFAVGIAKNSVRSAQIVNGTVRTVDLHNAAVTTPKIAPAAVGSEQLAEDAVSSPKVADGSLTGADIADGSLTGADIADASLSGADIAPNAIRATQLGTVTERNNSTAIKAGQVGSVTVNCEPGEQIVSGGGQPSVFGVEMTTTRPSNNGWLYQAKNNTGSDQTITAYALCLVQ